MTDRIEKRWRCTNSCSTFVTVGIPAKCPHCGNNHVFQVDDDAVTFDTPDEIVVNVGEEDD